MDNLGTWRTLFKVIDGLIWTSPVPATVAKDPSAVAIFLLLGHGEYVEKNLDEWVMWSVAPESMIQECLKGVSEAFNPNEKGCLPEYAKEQVPVGFSILLRNDLTLSTSSWLRPAGSCLASPCVASVAA